MSLAIKEMLLIEEPTIQILRDEMMKISYWFVLPSFVIALCLEYFSEFRFGEVVKKLILILTFISVFYSIHSEGVELSFKASEEVLRKVSPRNIFLKSWTEVKVRTKKDPSDSWIQNFAIPNINDLVGTALFVLSKAFIWILKLIYSTVYHLTYVFAPLTAILYFFPITKNSIGGTIQSSLWCIFMPIVLVSILAIVGNSIQVPAKEGALAIISIDHIVWIFGVTILLLMTPVLTMGILWGGGIALSGSAIGAIMTNSAMKVLSSAPAVAGGFKRTAQGAKKAGANAILEPSINEMIRKESDKSPNKEKLKQFNQKGGLRNPFRPQKSLEERLAKAGMTRNEATDLSKIPVKGDGTPRKSLNKSDDLTPQEKFQRQNKDTYLFDQSYWNDISPEHREGIRVKYGIKSETPTPNKLYYPVPRYRPIKIRPPRENRLAPPTSQRLERSKTSKTPQINIRKGERHEIRNI